MDVGRFEIVTQTGRDIQVLTLEFALNRFENTAHFECTSGEGKSC